MLLVKLAMNPQKRAMVNFLLNEVAGLMPLPEGQKLSVISNQKSKEWGVAVVDKSGLLYSHLLVADSEKEAKEILKYISGRI